MSALAVVAVLTLFFVIICASVAGRQKLDTRRGNRTAAQKVAKYMGRPEFRAILDRLTREHITGLLGTGMKYPKSAGQVQMMALREYKLHRRFIGFAAEARRLRKLSRKLEAVSKRPVTS